METIKQYAIPIILLLLILLGVTQFQKCKGDKEHKQNIIELNNAQAALQDSIKKTVNAKGDTVFVQKTVVYDLDELVKTPEFKQLSKEKQTYYNDLRKTKGLLAASQETIQKKDSIIALLTDTVGVRTDSTVCYHYGDQVRLERDTMNKMAYEGDITFEREKIKLAIKYDYKVQISSKVIEYKKDGSVLIEHSLDDPHATIIQGESFLAPAPKKNFWQKLATFGLDALKVGAGATIGYGIGKFTK